MLKITTIREDNKRLKVCLCGQFTSEYVPELEKALMPEPGDSGKVALDMSNVTFVDRQAMVFLCSAKSRNVAIENVPPYVKRWIEQERRCGPTFTECEEDK